MRLIFRRIKNILLQDIQYTMRIFCFRKEVKDDKYLVLWDFYGKIKFLFQSPTVFLPVGYSINYMTYVALKEILIKEF